MSELQRELTKEEYDATFSLPMVDVTETAEAIVDLWAYADPIIEDKYHDCAAWEWQVAHIYESRDGLYQHINIPVPKDDTYLSIVVHKPNRNIIGHYVLYLRALYPRTQHGTPEICPSCGQKHDPLEFAIPVSLPTEAAKIPLAQRDERMWSNGELCVVDDEKYYLYGSIEIAIHGHAAEFVWGAWVELGLDQFLWYEEHLDAEGREAKAPFAALLGTDIPYYPSTIDLPLVVHIQSKGYRPKFVLQHGSHPLIHDQEGGISVEQVEAIKDWFRSLSH